VGKPDLSAIRFTVNGSVFALGDFMNALVSFLLIATVIYFFVVLPINALTSEGSVIRKVFADHARGMEDALIQSRRLREGDPKEPPAKGESRGREPRQRSIAASVKRD
jgi:large-conductance mechanosensitive channel